MVELYIRLFIMIFLDRGTLASGVYVETKNSNHLNFRFTKAPYMQSFLPCYIYVKCFLYFTFNQAGVQLNSLLRRGGFRAPACLKLSFYMVYISLLLYTYYMYIVFIFFVCE